MTVTLDIDKLANLLESQCPEVTFAFLHGSAKSGEVKTGSDIDLALFVKDKPNWKTLTRVSELVHSVTPEAEPDVGFLNANEPIYRFEALNGRLLFCRDREKYLRFFSLTCREYELQIADYQRQQRYRLERSSLQVEKNG